MFHKILLSLLSALLLFFSWPPNGFSPIALVAFVPLFYLFKTLDKKREIFLYSFLTFLLWNFSTTYWIMHASLLGMILAVLVNSTLKSIVILISFYIKKKFDLKRAWWALLCFWLTFEYIHLNWDLTWPWLHLGNVFSSQVNLIQWYEYTGILGGTFWVLIANLFIVQAISIKYYRYASFLVVLLPLIISFLIKNEPTPKKKLNFVIVQPNVDPYFEKFDKFSESEQLDNFLELAKSKIDSTTDYLIGPETALVKEIWESKVDQANSIKKIKDLIKLYPNLKIILGATTVKVYDSKKTNTSRKFRNSTMYYDVFNSALQISKEDVQIYRKSKLVQGVEFIPFDKVLGWIDFLTIDLGGTSGSLGTQVERSVFTNKFQKVAPIICYESIYGEFVNGFVRNGAEILTVITNDGWWKDTPGYQQHLQLSCLRAIETRRALVRSANTGISAFISQNGQIMESTNWDEAIVISKQMPTFSKITFYVKYGDYIGRISSFLSVLFICFLIAKRK